VNVERREEWRRDSRGGWKPQEKGKKTLGKWQRDQLEGRWKTELLRPNRRHALEVVGAGKGEDMTLLLVIKGERHGRMIMLCTSSGALISSHAWVIVLSDLIKLEYVKIWAFTYLRCSSSKCGIFLCQSWPVPVIRC
jgi:hypothetical protein